MIFLEIFLRLAFGFGNPLLYESDRQIGYLLAPNQNVRRFGNRIQINQYSMRSSTVSTRGDSTFRVLMIGDSIVNGGWWTDQKNTLSEVLAHLKEFKPGAVEVLNASANSWGPRNELAYLQRFGLFQAQVVVLVINTDDLFATAPTSLPVGHDRNYPNRKPPLALIEVISRYLLPAPPISEALKVVQAEGGDRVGVNLEAILQTYQLVGQSKARFLLVMTPLLRELESAPRDYELVARQRLLNLTQTESIRYIDFLTVFSTEIKKPKDVYHDHIHLNLAGNKLVSDWISKTLQESQISPLNQ
ncbi:MAG: SGNH/GDSL hydrolase family protein [Phormidesmis sp. CAN_BIN36]|nr:SGNH/GDSL hydrolase family protein [Phormidesmis sp. CAN_BIN36]